jgi:Domain of unknown function (DUF4397)
MRLRPPILRLVPSAVATAAGVCMLTAGLVALAVPAVSAAPASAMPGWIRLAHLSPNTPPVDVYLYSFHDPHAMIVLHHVGYGAVSPYEKVKSGQYTVAMRGAGAKASSPPVLSTSVRIAPDNAYTVAGMGPAKGLRLQVLHDRLMAPKGKAEVRVIQASLRQHMVTVRENRRVLARNISFAHVTSYMVTSPGSKTMHIRGKSERSSQRIDFTPRCIHTLVVLDSSHGLRIDDLTDSSGINAMPAGGADTGLGGTAPPPAPASSPLPWLALSGAGALSVGAGAFGLRRLRHVAGHAR